MIPGANVAQLNGEVWTSPCRESPRVAPSAIIRPQGDSSTANSLRYINDLGVGVCGRERLQGSNWGTGVGHEAQSRYRRPSEWVAPQFAVIRKVGFLNFQGSYHTSWGRFLVCHPSHVRPPGRCGRRRKAERISFKSLAAERGAAASCRISCSRQGETKPLCKRLGVPL